MLENINDEPIKDKEELKDDNLYGEIQDKKELEDTLVNDEPKETGKLDDNFVYDKPKETGKLEDTNVVDDSKINENKQLKVPNLYGTLPTKKSLEDINVNQ